METLIKTKGSEVGQLRKVRVAWVEDFEDLAEELRDCIDELSVVEFVDVYENCLELVDSKKEYDYIGVDKEAHCIPSNTSFLRSGRIRELCTGTVSILSGNYMCGDEKEYFESLGIKSYFKEGDDFFDKMLPEIYEVFVEINDLNIENYTMRDIDNIIKMFG